MALLGWAHSKYWGAPGGVPPEPESHVGRGGGFVPWQSHLQTFGAGFGALQLAYEWLSVFVRVLWRILRCDGERLTAIEGLARCDGDRLLALARLARCDGDRLLAITRVAHVVDSPLYVAAQRAVRVTATKPGMRDHHYWHEIGRIAKAWSWSENIYRRMHANEAVARETNGPWTDNMDRELAVELAYGAYKDFGVPWGGPGPMTETQ